jgi:hypothetical protein
MVKKFPALDTQTKQFKAKNSYCWIAARVQKNTQTKCKVEIRWAEELLALNFTKDPHS